MKGHLYKFHIEHLQDAKGNLVEGKAMDFETRNHDDIFNIVDAMKGKMALDETDATAFAIGIKLFGEVMLKNPKHPLFKEFRPQFAKFMKALKNS